MTMALHWRGLRDPTSTMERQQLLKTSDRGVIFNGDVTSSRMAPLREDRVSSSSSPSTTYAKRLNQYETEARSGFLSAFSDFFAKNNSRSKSSFVCDVVVASVCLVFFSCCFFNIGAEASPVFSEKHFSTYHCEYWFILIIFWLIIYKSRLIDDIIYWYMDKTKQWKFMNILVFCKLIIINFLYENGLKNK